MQARLTKRTRGRYSRRATLSSPAIVAHRYPLKTDETIKALLEARVPPNEILRRLHAGETPLGRVPMPESTFFHRLRKLRVGLELDAPAPTVEAIRARFLRLVSRSIDRLERRERVGRLSSPDLNSLRTLGRMVEEMARTERTSGKTSQSRAGKTPNAGSDGLLERLRREEARARSTHADTDGARSDLASRNASQPVDTEDNGVSSHGDQQLTRQSS
jgi:hypothetical protein